VPNLTDVGNAERFATANNGMLRYCPDNKTWYVWTGAYWREDKTQEVLLRAKAVAKSIATEYTGDNSDTQTQYLRHARRSESLKALEAMIRLAQAESDMVMALESMNRDHWLLNTLSGTIDLRTGSIRSYIKDDNITLMAPVAYDAGADFGLWDEFLLRVMPDDADREFLQRAVGYSLTGSCREEVMFFIHGRGRNGKSTFVNILLDMLGPYAGQANPDAFLVRRSDGPRNDLYNLFGKRFVAASEATDESKFNDTLIKQVTGRDVVTVNPKFKDEFSYLPTWKLWFTANHRPALHTVDSAIAARVLLIPFTICVPAGARDPRLRDRITSDPAERSRVLTWAVEGASKWLADRLQVSKSVRNATMHYLKEQDVVGQFIVDCCTLHPDAVVTKGMLYQAFSGYCKRSGITPCCSITTFGNRLVEATDNTLRSTRHRGDWVWFGITLTAKASLRPSDHEKV